MAKPDAILIRPMTPADIPIVSAIENRVCISPWAGDTFSACLNAGFLGWVLEEDAQIIGYGLLSFVIDECQVLNLVIDYPWQGQGYGKKILKHMLDEATRLGAHHCYLEVRPSNEIANQLYTDMGFRQIGIRKDYYDAGPEKEDALVLSLDLL